MTGLFLLDWAIQAVSLFNVILLIWLGLTVLFNSEQRSGGILLASGGLLMGGAFFISHSALVGHETNIITAGQDFWWYLGWVPVVCLPFAWYMVMLWYTGFWESRRMVDFPDRRLYHRQRIWFVLVLLLVAFLAGLTFFAHLPAFSQLALSLTPSLSPATGSLSIHGIFPLAAVYPIYALLCMGLSLDALRHPGPSRRWLGELARRRAQPWLLAASFLLLAVSLLVGWTMGWIVLNLERGTFTVDLIPIIGIVDLIIASMIGLSVLALGQAVVSYEIFAARTLPRNGLFQHWRRAVILAASYSILVAWTLTIQLRPIYSLLLTTVLMTVFFAMLAWRSYAERERFMRSLRPFLAAPKAYTSILDPNGETALDSSNTFRSLCSDILETQQACIAPVGAVANLAGPPMLFPDQNPPQLPTISPLVAEFQSPDEKGLPLHPQQHQGFIWAIPLWNERGLIGVLLLGEKRTGGLYSQEEIEIARSAGERLIDLQASAELARRLAMLERQHLVQNQVIDQQTRRILHDEILPLIHTALLNLTSDTHNQDVIDQLSQVHRQISALLRSMSATLTPDVKHLGLLGALHQVVERDLGGPQDQVTWQVDPNAEALIQRLPVLESEVLFFAARESLRNAARYGRSSQDQRLEICIQLTCQNGLCLIIEDNGCCTEPNQQAFEAGSGQGIALHSTLMAVIGGALVLEQAPAGSTRVVLSLPITSLK